MPIITEEKLKNLPAGGALIGKRKGQTIIHNDGSLGGYAGGKLHKDGGIKGVVLSTGKEIEFQGEEIILTAPLASDNTLHEFDGKKMTKRQIASQMNVDSGGVAFADGGEIPKSIKLTGKQYNFGGKLMPDHEIMKSCGCQHSMEKGGQVDLFEVKEKILKAKPSDIVTVYHASAASNPILKEGIHVSGKGKTNYLYRKPGYVYVTMSPQAAYGYAKFSNSPDTKINVYEIKIPKKELLPDTGAIKAYGRNLKNNLEDSINELGLASVKRNIYLSEIKLYKGKVDFAKGGQVDSKKLKAAIALVKKLKASPTGLAQYQVSAAKLDPENFLKMIADQSLGYTRERDGSRAGLHEAGGNKVIAIKIYGKQLVDTAIELYPAEKEDVVEIKKVPQIGSLSTYNARVQENLKHMGTESEEWSAVPIIGFNVIEINGKDKAMPLFDFPVGYEKAPTLFPMNTAGEYNCELCSKSGITTVYHIKNDSKKLIMGVGSECVTHFGEGKSGKEHERQFKIQAAKMLDADLSKFKKIIFDIFSRKENRGYGKTERVWKSFYVGPDDSPYFKEKYEAIQEIKPTLLFRENDKNNIYWKNVWEKIPYFGYEGQVNPYHGQITDEQIKAIDTKLLSWYTRIEEIAKNYLGQVHDVLHLYVKELPAGTDLSSDYLESFNTSNQVESKFEFGGTATTEDQMRQFAIQNTKDQWLKDLQIKKEALAELKKPKALLKSGQEKRERDIKSLEKRIAQAEKDISEFTDKDYLYYSNFENYPQLTIKKYNEVNKEFTSGGTINTNQFNTWRNGPGYVNALTLLNEKDIDYSNWNDVQIYEWYLSNDEDESFASGGTISNTTLSELDKAKLDLARAEKSQDMMKKANSIIRGKKDVTKRLIEIGFTEKQAEEIQVPSGWNNRVGFASYALTNNNANISRLKERVLMLEAKVKGAEKAAEGKEDKYEFEKFGGGYIEINYPEDRVQIFFNDKQGKGTPGNTALNGNGWNFSFRNLCWQRKITPQAISNARYITEAKKVDTGEVQEVSEENQEPLTMEDIEKRNFTYVTGSIYDAVNDPSYTGLKNFTLVVRGIVSEEVKDMVRKYIAVHLPELDVTKIKMHTYPKTYVVDAKQALKMGFYLPNTGDPERILYPMYNGVKNFFKDKEVVETNDEVVIPEEKIIEAHLLTDEYIAEWKQKYDAALKEKQDYIVAYGYPMGVDSDYDTIVKKLRNAEDQLNKMEKAKGNLLPLPSKSIEVKQYLDLKGNPKKDFMLTKAEYLQKLRDSKNYPVMDELWERVRTGDYNTLIKNAIEYHTTIINNQRGTESEMRSAIKDGLITTDEAIAIIESAGLEVPEDILKNNKAENNYPNRLSQEQVFHLWKKYAKQEPNYTSNPHYHDFVEKEGLDSEVVDQLFAFNYKYLEAPGTKYSVNSLSELDELVKKDKEQLEEGRPEREAMTKMLLPSASSRKFKHMGDYRSWIEEISKKDILELTETEIQGYLSQLKKDELLAPWGGDKKTRVDKIAQMVIYNAVKNVADDKLTLEQYAIKKFIGYAHGEAMMLSYALAVATESYRKEWEKAKAGADKFDEKAQSDTVRYKDYTAIVNSQSHTQHSFKVYDKEARQINNDAYDAEVHPANFDDGRKNPYRSTDGEILSHLKLIVDKIEGKETQPEVKIISDQVSEQVQTANEKLKGVTAVEYEDDGQTLLYGTKNRKTRISVKGMSLQEMKDELEFEKKILAQSKKDVENFNEDEVMSARGLSQVEKQDAIKIHKQLILTVEQVEKIIIPFYEKQISKKTSQPVNIISEEITTPTQAPGEENNIDETWNVKKGIRLKKYFYDNGKAIVEKFNISSYTFDGLQLYLKFNGGGEGSLDLSRNATTENYNPPAYETLKKLSAYLLKNYDKEELKPLYKEGDYVKYIQGDIDKETWYGIIREVVPLEHEFVYNIDGFNVDYKGMDLKKNNQCYEATLRPVSKETYDANLKQWENKWQALAPEKNEIEELHPLDMWVKSKSTTGQDEWYRVFKFESSQDKDKFYKSVSNVVGAKNFDFRERTNSNDVVYYVYNENYADLISELFMIEFPITDQMIQPDYEMLVARFAGNLSDFQERVLFHFHLDPDGFRTIDKNVYDQHYKQLVDAGILYETNAEAKNFFKEVRLTEIGKVLVQHYPFKQENKILAPVVPVVTEVVETKYTYFKGIEANYKNPFELNKAIEEFLDSITEGQVLTPAEKSFIAYYSGYGGLEKFGADKGLLYEFFTPTAIVERMWGLAYKHGYKGGKVFEPACGTGVFVKYAPDQSLVTGHEINKYSYKICTLLFPNAKFSMESFETLFIKNRASIKNKLDGIEKFDLVIGNPPYGDFGGLYAGMGEKNYTKAENFVDYFITRGLDLLNDKGLLIYIIGTEVANGGIPWLNKGMSKAKAEIIQKANLLDAYRLPNGVFERTDVVSDIIVLQKK